MPRGLGTALRVVLFVLGGVVLLVGAAASVLIGSDDTAQTGPHDVFTPGVAIVTDAEALHYVGPTLHLTVEREDGEPVFLGVANEVDVASYVAGQSRRVVSRLKLPWTPTANETGTGLDALPAPGQQPWWIDSIEGAGAQTLVWPIPHGRYSIAVLNADGSPAVDVQVTLGLEVEGAFTTALAVAAFGLALLLVGLWLWIRSRRRWPPATVGPDQPHDPYPPNVPYEPHHRASSAVLPVAEPPAAALPGPAGRPRPVDPGHTRDEVTS